LKDHLSSNQIVLQENTTDELTEQDTEADVKYQDIIYYMDNKSKVIRQKEHAQIDFFKATSEMNDLDWKYEDNFIGFDNYRTDECVQFIRQGQDKWYAEVPICKGREWDGYAWSSYSDSKTITNLLRLFFEEVPWFGMLSWKMRRFKH